MPCRLREGQEKAEYLKSRQTPLAAAVVEWGRGIPVIKGLVPDGYVEGLSRGGQLRNLEPD